jgi:hypothetical protein
MYSARKLPCSDCTLGGSYLLLQLRELTSGIELTLTFPIHWQAAFTLDFPLTIAMPYRLSHIDVCALIPRIPNRYISET